jgi:hypothetical protein
MPEMENTSKRGEVRFLEVPGVPAFSPMEGLMLMSAQETYLAGQRTWKALRASRITSPFSACTRQPHLPFNFKPKGNVA